MQIDPEELERLTLEHFSEAFIRASVECVFIAREAGNMIGMGEFAAPEAENVRGLNVRAKLEGLLRTTAARFGLEATVIRAPGQAWWHTEIKGGPIVLTAAAVQYPAALVRPCDYRRGLAESNQMTLWEPENATTDSPIYTILTHSPNPDKDHPELPGSVYLVYPAADLDGYVHSINLIEEHEDVAMQRVPDEWDQEARLRYLRQTSNRGLRWA